VSGAFRPQLDGSTPTKQERRKYEKAIRREGYGEGLCKSSGSRRQVSVLPSVEENHKFIFVKEMYTNENQ
jgi:hypothetical protein